MTIAYFCVMIAGLMPILWTGYAKITGGFNMQDNEHPRLFLKGLSGKSQRAQWAQENSWEAFAPFAAAVIIASHIGLEQSKIDLLAMSFVAARVFYGVFYILGWGRLRSLVWLWGMASYLLIYGLCF